jgi:hypothetical protein
MKAVSILSFKKKEIKVQFLSLSGSYSSTLPLFSSSSPSDPIHLILNKWNVLCSMNFSTSDFLFSSSDPMAYSSVSLVLFLTTLTSCYGNKLGLDFHHRFSVKVREWTDSRGLPPSWNPEEAPHGSVEYHKRLFKYDLHRHRSCFSVEGDLYSFSHGNKTFQYLDKCVN